MWPQWEEEQMILNLILRVAVFKWRKNWNQGQEECINTQFWAGHGLIVIELFLQGGLTYFSLCMMGLVCFLPGPAPEQASPESSGSGIIALLRGREVSVFKVLPSWIPEDSRGKGKGSHLSVVYRPCKGDTRQKIAARGQASILCLVTCELE